MFKTLKNTWWAHKVLGESGQALRRQVAKFFYVIFASLIVLSIIFTIFFKVTKLSSAYSGVGFLAKLFLLFFAGYQDNGWSVGEFPKIWTFYLLIGLASALCFRSRIFNIGISGQLIVAGTVAINLLKHFEGTTQNNVTTAHFFLVLFLCCLLSSFASLLIGVLKLYFNTHEVISSIFLNWTFYYVAKHSFTVGRYAAASPTTKSVALAYTTLTNNFFGAAWLHWMLLTLAVLLALACFVLFRWTTLGFKLEAMGMSSKIERYAGFSRSRQTLLALGFSGFLVGIAAFVYYVLKEQEFRVGFGPEVKGFEAFGISLLAYNSPLGVVLTSWFFASLDVQSLWVSTATLEINSEILTLIKGTFTIFAAVATIFDRFKLFRSLKHTFLYLKADKKFLPTYFGFKKQLFLAVLRGWFQSATIFGKTLVKRPTIWKQQKKLREFTTQYLWAAQTDDAQKEQAFLAYNKMKKTVELTLTQAGYYDQRKHTQRQKLLRKTLRYELSVYKNSLLNFQGNN